MIEIEHLTKYFGSAAAVNDLSMFVPKGQLFAFLGPNGAGKTTTIKMLCGLMRPSSGRIHINGIDIQQNSSAVREFIGYIPDSPYLYDRLTPTEFFEFIGDLYHIPRQTLLQEQEKAFSLFGIQKYAQFLIKDLSHGFRQRLIYASAFLHQPEVLFVDEPFVGLDPYSIRLIQDMLRQKTRAGMTVFLTTHILALAENIADRIGIIADGRLIALGTLAELKRQSSVSGALEDIFLNLTQTIEAES